MGSAIISGCGKLNINDGESNLLYLNIIYVPVAGINTRSRFMFFSKQEVNNINDFLDVLNFYRNYDQPIILVGGDYVIRSTTSSQGYNRYAVVDLFKSSADTVNLTYRDTISTADNSVSLFQVGGETPTNWLFSNIKMQ